MHRYIIFLFLIIIGAPNVNAQNKQLQRQLSVHWVNVSLTNAFQELSQKIGLEFSYSADIVSDRKIDYKCKDKDIVNIVKDIVGPNCTVDIHNNYLIIKLSKNKIPEIILTIIDRSTGKPIPYVSILSASHWTSAMTDEDGVATVSLMSKESNEKLQIRHINYVDTSIAITNSDALVKIYLTQKIDTLENILLISKLQKSFWSFLLPKYLKQQSLNLHSFFKKGPAQFSFLPGISTRGRLQSQAVNNFSVNVLGGYSMGTDGLELGGLFNLSQGSSHALQVGGLTNMVGGSFSGLQVAGLHNNVMDTIRGLQLSGMSNKTENVLKGVQFSPFYNEARVNKGLQIGLVNASDSSCGYSIGILNLVKSGHFGLHAFSSDFFSAGLGFRTGTRRSFTELVLAYRGLPNDRFIMAGLVLGTEIPFSKNVGLELSIGGYTGLGGYIGNVTKTKNFDDKLLQYSAMLHFPLMKNISFLGGLSRYSTEANKKLWWGWQGGVVWYLNQIGKMKQPLLHRKDWDLSFAISGGANQAFDNPVYGVDFQIKRKLDNRVFLQFTQGYSYYGGSDIGYYPVYSSLDSYKFNKRNIFRSLLGISFYPKNQNRFYLGSSVGLIYLHKPAFAYSPYVGWDISSSVSVEGQMLGTDTGGWKYSSANINLRFNLFK